MKTNYYVIALLSIIVALASCSKQVVEPSLNIDDRLITIKEAQDYYKLRLSNASSAKQLAIGEDIQKIENSPNWRWASEKLLGEQQAVIVPLQYKQYIALRSYDNDLAERKILQDNDSKLSMNELSFMYFYKDNSGNIVQETVLQVPDKKWVVNPTKQFSGRVIVLDESSNFKKGITLENGVVKGYFRQGESSRNGRPNLEICGYIEVYGMNYQIDGNGNPTHVPIITTLGAVPIYCTLAPDISTGTQIPAPYYGPGAFYSPVPALTEAQYFQSVFVVDPGANAITNVRNYLKCFSNQSNNTYRLTVSVDQPIAGSSAPVNPLALGNKHFVGHTYITLTQIQPSGETTQRTMGFYPLYGGSPLNPNVPAVFNDDSHYSGGWDVQLTFPITGSEMMNIVNYIPNYTNANYDLGLRNCGNFATDVLGRIGVNVAQHWMWQYWYSVNDAYGGMSSTTIQGPSIGSLGEQLYNTPPTRTMTKSHAGGEPPKNLGICN